MLVGLFGLLLLIACGYQKATVALVRRFRRFEVDPPVARRPRYAVSQLKPVHGVRARTGENFLSALEQDYLGEWEAIFSVGKPGDPAGELARSLGVTVAEGDANGSCPNRKVASMLLGYSHCKHSILVCSDAEMCVPSNYLDKMTAPFADDRVGMTTALYIIQRVHRPALALEALSIVDFATSVLVARVVEGLSFGLGANMTFRREALEEIGGLPAVGNYLAEDYQLANRIYRAGWKIALAGVIAESAVSDMSFSEYFSHQLRWMRTYRVSRPGGHFFYIITQGTFWVLALSFLLSWPYALSVAVLWWALRISCARTCWDLLGGVEVNRWIYLVPFKDLLYLVLWVMSLFGHTVRWGADTLKLRKDGKIERI